MVVTSLDNKIDREKMNPLKAVIRFLKGEPGSFRFGEVSHTLSESELRYETIADGNRHMREDLMRLGSDMKDITGSVSDNGKED